MAFYENTIIAKQDLSEKELKSIKNKYLSASDGALLGVTTNTENVSLKNSLHPHIRLIYFYS